MGLREREQKSAAERWERALGDLIESTRTAYRREFERFLEWADETPDGLIAYWTEIMADSTRNMGLSDAVNDYVSELNDQGYSGGKQKLIVKAVRKFYDVNGFSPVINVKHKPDGSGSRIATKEEIKRILAYSIENPRNQAIVAITKDSGLRLSDIISIQVKHIQPVIDDSNLNWLIFKLPVTKTRRQGKYALPTFGPDAVKYLRLWLVEREKIGISNDDPEAYVFVNMWNKIGSILGETLSANAASITIQSLCDRAGLPDLSANSFRKFNTTRLSVGGLAEDKIKFIQGKHQQSSIESYLSFEAEEILPLYQQAYHELELDETESRMNGLEAENTFLKQRLQNIEKMLNIDPELATSQDFAEDDKNPFKKRK